MKRKLIDLICLAIILSFTIGCREHRKIKLDCDREVENIVRLTDEFYFTDEKAYLDSALMYIDNVIDNCPQWRDNMLTRKAIIYYESGRYKDAISIVNEFKDDFLPLSYSKTIILNKIRAKENLQNGDSVSYRKYIGQIVDEYDDLIKANQKRIDSILALPNPDDIFMSGELPSYVQCYYYYKEKLIGKDKTLEEIDKLENEIHGNYYFFRDLKNIISNTGNYSLTLLFD